MMREQLNYSRSTMALGSFLCSLLSVGAADDIMLMEVDEDVNPADGVTEFDRRARTFLFMSTNCGDVTFQSDNPRSHEDALSHSPITLARRLEKETLAKRAAAKKKAQSRSSSSRSNSSGNNNNNKQLQSSRVSKKKKVPKPSRNTCRWDSVPDLSPSKSGATASDLVSKSVISAKDILANETLLRKFDWNFAARSSPLIASALQNTAPMNTKQHRSVKSESGMNTLENKNSNNNHRAIKSESGIDLDKIIMDLGLQSSYNDNDDEATCSNMSEKQIHEILAAVQVASSSKAHPLTRLSQQASACALPLSIPKRKESGDSPNSKQQDLVQLAPPATTRLSKQESACAQPLSIPERQASAESITPSLKRQDTASALEKLLTVHERNISCGTAHSAAHPPTQPERKPSDETQQTIDEHETAGSELPTSWTLPPTLRSSASIPPASPSSQPAWCNPPILKSFASIPQTTKSKSRTVQPPLPPQRRKSGVVPVSCPPRTNSSDSFVSNGSIDSSLDADCAAAAQPLSFPTRQTSIEIVIKKLTELAEMQDTCSDGCAKPLSAPQRQSSMDMVLDKLDDWVRKLDDLNEDESGEEEESDTDDDCDDPDMDVAHHMSIQDAFQSSLPAFPSALETV